MSIKNGLVFLVLLVSLVSTSNAEMYGQIYGTVIGKKVDLGATGMTNQITLTVNTNDGNSWFVICRRADANLGWCDPVTIDSSLYSEGVILPFSVPSKSTGWVSPSFLQWMPPVN